MAVQILTKVLLTPVAITTCFSSQVFMRSSNLSLRSSMMTVQPFHSHNKNIMLNKFSFDPIQEQLFKENCLLVDENDKVVGYKSKRDCHTVVNNSIPLHRAFSVFLFNENNELLLQQRSRYKITYPEYFTNTCCSHPLYDHEDETKEKDNIGVKIAAQRRLNYELGIPTQEIGMDNIKCITRIHYFDKGDGVFGEHEIDYIVFIKKNVTININKNEIHHTEYVGMDKMEDFLKSLHYPITPWFHFVVQSKLYTWWKNLDQILNSPTDNVIHKF
uniref:isopentenyl-diphosphate Delta-isomerase n=1 Tax=Cacopsylla melanoneura TaxID=428564 RepID=A0A8D8WM50_9HEMI